MASKERIGGRLHLLTARGVMAAGDGKHADGGGLVLRVQAGDGVWVLRYTSPTGKRREMGLGQAYRATPAQAGQSLTAARDLAHQARELLRRNLDPIDERDRARAAEREAQQRQKAERERDSLTLQRAARDYHRRVIDPTRTPKHSAQWIASLENHVPPDLWRAPVSSLTAPALLQALESIKPHERARNLKGDTLPETVRRLRQRLDAIFEDLIFHGHLTANPASALKRRLRESVRRGPRGAFAALDYREAPALFQRLRAVEGTASKALQFAMLTAARTGEVLGACWSEFDLRAGVWTVPAERMKAKETHAVHLTPRALDIVRAQAGQSDTLVFPSPMPGRQAHPLSNMAMLTTLGRLDVRDRTTVHGLCRATFSTWANETGAARPDVIEACLAHREGDRIRAAYNRARFESDRRELLRAWEAYLLRPAATVLPMPMERNA